MSFARCPSANSPPGSPDRRSGRRIASLLLAAGLAASALTGFAAASASASTVCDPGTDVCVVVPDAVQTPLGTVTVAAGPDNVVTVQFTPAAQCTKVIAIPFAIPPGPPGLPGYSRTTIATAGGVVNVDTLYPPGPPCRSGLPNLAIISIHPPGPCRVRTIGTTVMFIPVTPVIPPGPPA